jgi:hypothetical protein
MDDFEVVISREIDLGESTPANALFDLGGKRVGELAEGESGFLMPQAVLVAPDGSLWMRRRSLACATQTKSLPLRVVRRGDEIYVNYPLDPKQLKPTAGEPPPALMPVRVCRA